MRITQSDWGVTTVVVSRRNLLSLLYKLTVPGSHRRLEWVGPNGDMVNLVAEPDAVHYAGRPAAGRMNAATEAYIQSQEQSDARDV